MLAKKQSKRIIAIGISLALLLTSLICANAEVNLTSSATVEDADIIFEEPTLTTGSIGWKEQTGDSVNEVKLDNFAYPTGYVVGSNKLVGDNGLYKIAGANGNWNWTCMYEYDETAGGLKYTVGSAYGFEAAYKVDTKDYSVAAIKSFEGRIYSSSFEQDNATAGIILNYIDSGNYDYIYPHIKHDSDGKIYIRFYSVRTKVVTENGVSYKQVYSTGQIDQDWGPEFSISSQTINGESLYYVDFSIEYTDSGVNCTFTGTDSSYTRAITNDFFMNANAKEIKSYWSSNEIIEKVSNFGEYPLCDAKGVGFACKNYDKPGYVDNVKVTFNYNKSVADLATEFRTNHAEILAKPTATEADKTAIDAALTDYNAIITAVPAAADELSTEKAKLDALKSSILDTAVGAYFTAHSDALAVTLDTVSSDNVAKVIAAKSGYNALSDTVKAGVLARYNSENSTSYTDLNTLFDALVNAVYYDKDGALIYDDMSGANADAWTTTSIDTEFKYINATADKTINSVTYNYVVDLPGEDAAEWVDFKNDMMYFYQSEGSLYGSIRMGYHTTESKMFFQMSNFINVNGNASYQAGAIWLDPVTSSDKAHVSVTYDYDLATLYADASTLPYGSVGYAAKYIKVPMKVYVEESQQTVECSYISVYPNENGTALSDKFSVGIRSLSDTDALQLESIEITYAKSADEVSAEFEAYADTYKKNTSAVTKDDTANINAAIAIYNGLNDTKKAVYANEYNALVVLKAVADVHTEIEAITVTPASEKTIAAAADKLAALNVTNATVSASLTAKQTAFDAFRPVMYSATIKKAGEETQQDLRFKSKFTENTYSANIVSYGTVMVPNLALGTSELVIGGSYVYNGNTYSAVNAAYTLETGEEMPSEFYGYLSDSGATDNRCGTRIAARAYIVYEVDGSKYTVYSTASRNVDESVVTAGVKNGVCVRSVYSVARAMAKDLVSSGTFTTTDKITANTTVDDLSSISGTDILVFTAANVSAIENLN